VRPWAVNNPATILSLQHGMRRRCVPAPHAPAGGPPIHGRGGSVAGVDGEQFPSLPQRLVNVDGVPALGTAAQQYWQQSEPLRPGEWSRRKASMAGLRRCAGAGQRHGTLLV